jgi:hypothetical protein
MKCMTVTRAAVAGESSEQSPMLKDRHQTSREENNTRISGSPCSN